MKIDYPIQIIWSEEDETYVSFAPDLPGCFSDGETQEDALKNIRVVIGEWLETASELKRDIPAPSSAEAMAKRQVQALQVQREQINKQIQSAVVQVVEQLQKQQAEQAIERYATHGFYRQVFHAGTERVHDANRALDTNRTRPDARISDISGKHHREHGVFKTVAK